MHNIENGKNKKRINKKKATYISGQMLESILNWTHWQSEF